MRQDRVQLRIDGRMLPGVMDFSPTHQATLSMKPLLYLSPLGWDHINLTRAYLAQQRQDRRVSSDRCEQSNRPNVLYFPFLGRPLLPGQAIGFRRRQGRASPSGLRVLALRAAGRASSPFAPPLLHP